MSSRSASKCCTCLSNRFAIQAYTASNSLELSRNFGSEPALIGLLKVYKEYYPDVIVSQSAAGKSLLFEVNIS